MAEAELERRVEEAASHHVVWVEVVVEVHAAVEELTSFPLVVVAAAFETQAEDGAAEDLNVAILATTFLDHHFEVA